MKIGITGGIGTGKSYVCQRLRVRGIEVYDCDQAAKRLINTSASIRRQLTELIGEQAYVGGKLNKPAVAQFLLKSAVNAHAIDAIVHPAVFHDFEQSGMLWMESAILFESGICRLVDYVVAVSAPEEVRVRRVMQRDGISREKVLQWMGRQLPQEEVCRRADRIIFNDGVADIDSQVEALLSEIR